MDIQVTRVPLGVYQANCFLAYDKDTKEGFIVDPGGDAPYLDTVIEEHGMVPKWILLTHGHGDHIGCVPEIKKKYDIPIFAHEDEKELLNNANFNLSNTMITGALTFDADYYCKDNEVLPILSGVKVIHTPGHTAGSVCFAIEDKLFTGDTLFVSSIGRTDLPTASASAMEMSLDTIKRLDPNYFFYPGHGPGNSLAREMKTNPFLRA